MTTTSPLLYAFGLHLHQPVGNFDEVFEQHLHEVYAPLVGAMEAEDLFPATLHLSGPLLAWLETHGPALLDRLGRLAGDGRLELLLSGYDEPILAMLPPADRLEQVARMREAVRRRFGVEATGLWLTERVWEPDLALHLAEAGIRYALVDDRHFLVAGHTREALHLPWQTEAGGRTVALFPIDEQLRYLVPFRPPEELAEYLRGLRHHGHRLAVLADDGEKFGGWPGTRKWVYDDGWFARYGATLRALREAGEIRLVTFAEALATLPSAGLTYLPSASYREMEGWALPAEPARHLRALEAELGEERLRTPDGALVRGTHWKTFLVKYPESNRMHKKMLALSALARARGDDPVIRAAIGRAQCNDAYWHGVFGGLYLPHLREPIWKNLAAAEQMLRQGEPLVAERIDLDGDGHEEVWIHSSRFSAMVSPRRGGGIEEFTRFDEGYNYADVLRRRFELYHERPPRAENDDQEADDGGTPSIHDLEAALVLDQRPPVDPEPRGIFLERLVGPEVTREAMMAGTWTPEVSWALQKAVLNMIRGAGELSVVLTFPGLEKSIGFAEDGTLTVNWQWQPPADGGDLWFLTEVSLFRPLSIEAPGAEEWRYPVETVAMSERGFDRTVQGEAVVLRWPAARGEAEVRLA